MDWLNSMRTCGFAMAVAVLVACNPANLLASPGEITLSYSDASDSSYFFVLENRSAQAIYIRISKTIRSEGIPLDTAMECTQANSAIPDDAPFPLLDGGNFKSIKVSPEERRRLKIEKSDIVDKRPFAVRYEGGHCHLRLRLQNGAVIESKEFQL